MFIALWPDCAVRAKLRAWRDSTVWPKPAAPVRTEQLHVTLHFLGAIEQVRLPELVQGLGVGFAPFELGLGHAELWHGGIAVLAPDVAPAPLLALHGVLGEALARLGLPLGGAAVPPARHAGAPCGTRAGADQRSRNRLADRWLRADGVDTGRWRRIRRRPPLPRHSLQVG